MASGIQGNVSFPWQIIVLAVCLLAIFFSGNIAGADWWKVVIPACIMSLIAFLHMLR